MSFSEYKECEIGRIPNDWEIGTLGEYIELIIDYRGKTPKKLGGDWCETGYRALSAKNIKTGKIVREETIRFLNKEIYSKWMKEEIEIEDILLTSEAPLGEVLLWDTDEKIVLSQRLYAIRANKDIIYPKYLYAYMTSPMYKAELNARASGTTVLGIRQTELVKTKILLPPISEQKVIGDLIYNIDKKIEANNKLVDNLQEFANRVFKRWFIEYQFPNENEEPYQLTNGKMRDSEIGRIPEEWKIVTLGEYIRVKHGYAFKSKYFSEEETERILVTPGNFKIGGGFQDKKYKYYSVDGELSNEYILNKNDLIITMTDLSREGDTLGYPAIVPSVLNKVLLHNQRIGKVEYINNETPKYYLYMLMCSDMYRHHILATSTGTTVKHTAPTRVTDYKFAIPKDTELMERYNKLVEPIVAKNQQIMKENIYLQEMKDVLLSKLISGKIRVSDL